MKTLAVTGLGKMELQESEIPKVTSNQVLIQVAYCGVCGSDLPRYFEGGVHAFPQVLGHEFSGVVTEVGSEVRKLKKGDRVAVAPLIPLTPPEDWAGNNPAMGEEYSFIGSRQQGAMAEFIAVPERNCIKVPDSLPLDKAALVEPLTVAIHGVERLKIKAGKSVLVLGSGTIGLLVIAVLRARGVGEIVAVDVSDNKLKLAQNIGADVVINPLKESMEKYYSAHANPEVVIETAGSPITQKQSLQFVSKMGQICYVGTMTKPITFEPEEFEQILRKEVILTGAWMSYSSPFPGYEWDAALRYLDTGEVDVTPFITGVYGLEDKALPFELLVKEGTEHIKVIYKINDL